MRLKKKNLWIFTVILCFCLLAPANVRAETQSSIFADPVTLSAGEEQMIPVMVQNGTQLMGFRLTLVYDPQAVTVTNVTAGKQTGNGLFNHSMQLQKSSFDIVWSSAEPLGADGEILELYVKAQEGFQGDTAIKVTSTKQDTFDSDFQEVSVACKKIQLKIDSANDTKTDRSNQKDSNKKDSNENDSNKKASNQKDSKKEDPDKKSDAEQDYYKKEISDEILAKTDENEVRKIIDTAKEKNHVSKTEDLTAAQSREIFRQLTGQMEKEGASASRAKKLYEKVEEEELPALIAQILDSAELQKTADLSSVLVEKELAKSDSAGRMAAKVLISAVVLAGIVVFLILRKKKRKNL